MRRRRMVRRVIAVAVIVPSILVVLVAAGAIDIDMAVPMIMGANIGTTVTNTLVSIGSAPRTDEFRRAFATATVHDFFNVFAVAILLPIELVTGVLSNAAGWLSEQLVGKWIIKVDIVFCLRR